MACPRFSFIIPALNEASGLPELLASLRAGFAGAELIVVDGGSSDDTVPMAMRGADLVLVGERGRAAQMNLGAAAATGEWLLFLHADTRPEFAAEDLARHVEAPIDWAFCRVRLVGRRTALRLISRAINLRSRLSMVATGDQMLMVRRACFAEEGGFASIPLMEDVEICKRLRRSCKGRALELTVASSGRRWDEQGVVSTVLRMWLLRFAYWAGVSPERLWEHYYGKAALPQAGSGAN